MEPIVRNEPSTESGIIGIAVESPSETKAIGVLLGSFLRGGDVLCLDGDLGAGKTVFTSGIAKALGICGVIASPTFTILIEHRRHEPEFSGMPPLFHFDAYRLGGEEDFYGLGFDEYFSTEGVCVIEWADLIRSAIPPQAVWITLRRDPSGRLDRRILTFAFPAEDGRAAAFGGALAAGDWRKP